MLGFRAVDLVAEYTGHPYDNVLSAYFAEARMYDAADRRFLAADPIKGTVTNPLTLVPYTYVLDNPMKYVDLLGLISRFLAVTDKSGNENLVYLHDDAFASTDYVEINELMGAFSVSNYNAIVSSDVLDPYYAAGYANHRRYAIAKESQGMFVTNRSVYDYFYVIFCDDKTYVNLNDFLRGAGMAGKARILSDKDAANFNEVYIHGLKMKYNPKLGLAELKENDPDKEKASYDPTLPYETYKQSDLWSWGNPEVIYALLSVVEEWGKRYPGQKLRFGDMSMADGSGGTHKSHEMGLSLDAGLIGINGPQAIDISDDRYKDIYSYEKTKELIDLFIATGIVQKTKGLYFNDEAIHTNYTLAEPLSGHDNHLHFNFDVGN
jgi:RHS repeat-associated protein